MDIIKQRILKAMSLTDDFYNNIVEDYLRLRIEDVPSNTIGEQAYCIVGARESYLKSFKKGLWVSFKCSLIDVYNKDIVVNKLEETQKFFT